MLFPHAIPLGLITLLAACNAKSGGGPDTVLEFAAASSTVAEGGPPIAVTVRLRTSLRALPSDVVVLVHNAGTGNALNGVDVAPVPDFQLTFAADTLDGAQQTFLVSALDDALVEGANETLRLELLYDSGPAAIGDLRTHAIGITDGDVGTLLFHAPASATLDESAGARPIEVELDLPPGTSLACSLRARVSDAHSGTASAGSDYATFLPVEVEFPPGSIDGALASAALSVVQDTDIEADESVVLTLATNSAGAQLGAVTQHILTITNDDIAPAPHLTVSGAGGASLASGALLDVGTQFSGGGPNSGVLLEVDSPGPATLALGLPLIAGADERDFSLELATGALTAGFDDFTAARASPVRRSADSAGLGVQLELDREALASTEDLERVAWLDFPLSADSGATLLVERLPSPWSSDARIVVDGHDLDVSPAELTRGLTLWRGRVLGDDDSSVFLALSPAGPRGWVARSNTAIRQLVFIEPSRDVPGRSIAVEAGALDALGLPGPTDFCADGIEPPESGSPAVSTLDSSGSGAAFARCRIALESDYQLFQRFGAVNALTQYVTQLVAAASARYRVDVQTELEIAYLGVHVQPNDGWITPDLPGTATQVLDEFRAAWAPSSGGTWPVTANLAHFLSGASLGGGVAYLGVLCNSDWGFGVSGNLNGAIAWSSWSGASTPLAWDFVVFAHEIGHNFSASHTHAYCPPLDRCAVSCQGAAVCSSGTLMSYCHLCAGGMSNIELVFHPFVANVMRSAVNNSCLGSTALAAGVELTWRIRFAPTAGIGPRQTTLSFEHDADNAPTPFTLELRATAVP